VARSEVLHKAFDEGLVGLSDATMAVRLRLALASADEAALDWNLADDHIDWECAEDFLRHHVELESLGTGQAFCEWLAPDVCGRLIAFIEERRPIDPQFTIEFESVKGTSREWFEMRATRLMRDNGSVERVVGVLRRITEQKNTLNRLTYLANYDELTGQLNRSRLREELSLTIESAKTESRGCAYFVAAIDKLAAINETYGFGVADEVIVAAGNRLARSLRGSDIIGRIAGNKFGVILSNCSNQEMSLVAERLNSAVRSEVIETPAGTVSATISVGAVWLPENASTSQEAMLQAEESLERSRSKGRSGFAVYVKSAQREFARRRLMSIADDIMAALNENRLVLAYQPIVRAKSRVTEHYECLCRMVRKDGTLAPAGEFIPVAETLGLIRLVDRRTLEMTIAQLQANPEIKLSLNVSGTNANDRPWLNAYVGYVQENAEVANRLTVELTETAALHAFEENAQFATRLRKLGCSVAIDDFGAGYTSFRNLQALNFDMVKIDGSYITNLAQSPDNQVFVRTLVGLAKNFELDTVAEWVDSEEDAKILSEYGVDYFQGFHFGRPDTAPTWLKKEAVPETA
jgi:diguanylate cyclase (GGDEF)-like protein